MNAPIRNTVLAALLAFAAPSFANKTLPPVANANGQSAAAHVTEDLQPQTERPRIEVAFVLDTTSSMGGLIEGAKQKIWSIASKIARGQPTPQLRVGLVAYRDKGDAYVAKRFDLTPDLDSVYLHLKEFRAEGGGDTPEHVGRGLGEAVKSMEWSGDKKVMKLIFVVGDAPPQQYQDGWDYRDWARKAWEKGIAVNTVRCGSDGATEIAWREISTLGHGTYTSIAEDGGMVAAATPYDEKIAKLNAAIAEKTLYAGKAPAREEARRKMESVAALPASSAADRVEYLRATSKDKGSIAPAAAAPGTRDLLAEPASVAGYSDAELPESLQGMAKPAQQAKVEELAKERKALETEAVKAAKERDEWVTKNRVEKKDSFDAQVMEGVKKQAAGYGMSF